MDDERAGKSTVRSDQELLAAVRRLEARISRIEEQLKLVPADAVGTRTAAAAVPPGAEPESAVERGLEQTIGEFGLAWFGSAVLLLGIAFLMTYTASQGHPVLASVFGFLAAAGLYLTGRTWKGAAAHISDLFINASLVTLYYATARLHYFSADPILASPVAGLFALLLVVAAQFLLAAVRETETLAIAALVLGLASGILGDRAAIGLPLLAVLSWGSTVLAQRKRWWTLTIVAPPLIYAAHVMWLLGNPLMGHPAHAIGSADYGFVYLFACAAAFSLPAFLNDPADEPRAIVVLALNCFFLLVTASLAVFALSQNDIVRPYFALAAFFLACSVGQWLKSRQELPASLYACFGYVALSIAMYGYAGVPAVFLWLALQSLLVVTMALWFRSRFLVVVNALIFMSILLGYVAAVPSSDWVNFSFALVGHASARVMNWKRERLTLRTELLRTFYLLTGFLFVLYGLYHTLPRQYVSLGWMAAAVVYLSLSIVLRNVKYRWLAMGSVLLTLVHLFVVDLPQLDPKYRVPAFLLVGAATLLISIYYSKFRNYIGRRQ
jgi:hypothetical protein